MGWILDQQQPDSPSYGSHYNHLYPYSDNIRINPAKFKSLRPGPGLAGPGAVFSG